MARPKKQGLDYFPHDCDASHDEKVESLCALYGHHVGYSIIFRLFERIYRAGGKLLVSEAETMQILAKNVAEMPPEEFQKVLQSCLKIGIFDEKLFREAKILTSSGILKRMKPIVSKRLKMKEIYQKNKNPKEVSTPISAAETKQKPHKVKESKGKKRILSCDTTKIRNGLIDIFFQKHSEKTGQKYVVQGGKDGSAMKAIEEQLGREEVIKRMEVFFTSQDKFILEAGYSIAVFKACINKLIPKQMSKVDQLVEAAKKEQEALNGNHTTASHQ